MYLCNIWLVKHTIFNLKKSYETVKMSDTYPNNRGKKLLAPLFLLYIIQGYKKRIRLSIIFKGMIYTWNYIVNKCNYKKKQDISNLLIFCFEFISSDTTKISAIDSTYSLPKIMQNVLKWSTKPWCINTSLKLFNDF